MIVVSVIGLSKSGKTSLVEKLVAELKHRGLTVGTVKVSGHARLDGITPEKDTARHEAAGADFVLGFAKPDTGRLTLDDVAGSLPYEPKVLVCEGLEDHRVPCIIVARDMKGYRETLKVRDVSSKVLAVTNPVAMDKLDDYSLPLFDSSHEDGVINLVDLLVVRE